MFYGGPNKYLLTWKVFGSLGAKNVQVLTETYWLAAASYLVLVTCMPVKYKMMAYFYLSLPTGHPTLRIISV